MVKLLRSIQCLSIHLLYNVVFVVFVVACVESLEPRFTKDPQPITARLGDDVTLSCTINPPAPILWFANGFPLISNTSYEFKFDDVTGEHRVIIKNISVQRDGQYYCRMQSIPVKSQPAQVTVLVAPSQIKLVPFNPVTVVQENIEASLTCVINGGKPAPTVQWYKDDVLIDAGTVDTHITSTDTITKIENVTSVLKWIPIRGEHEKRIYCTALHPALQGGSLRVETQLMVEYPPTVKIATVPEIIKEGDSVTLQCIVDANPYIDLKFRWTKNDLPIQQQSPDVSTGGSLHIENIQRSERATLYTCEATNKLGTSSAGYLLNVHYAPTFFSMPEVYAADMNSDTFLTCNVDSNPPAVISWQKDTSSQVIGRDKVLPLHIGSEHDLGSYSCVAITPGYAPIRKEIKVLKKGPPFISAEASVYAGQGDSSVQIKCIINGLPQPTSVRWLNPQGKLLTSKSMDQPVDITQEILSDRVISRLTIKNIKKDDFGMYNCSASNAYGGNERLIPLKETDWMVPIIAGGACGSGLLLAVIVIMAILCIRCRSHRRLKQTSDTSGSTTTSDDLDTKSPNGGVLHPSNGGMDIYNTSNETLNDGANNNNNNNSNNKCSWHTALAHSGPQDICHAHPYTIHSDYISHKDPQNYYTRYADYEQEYNPSSFMTNLGIPAIYTPTLSITEQQDHHQQTQQEGSRDPSPYHHTSGLPRLAEPLYVSRYNPTINGSVMMLDATLNSRLATNV